MTGSTPTLLIPVMSETIIQDTVTTSDQSHLATSSNQHLHLNGSLTDDIHNHSRSENVSNRKTPRDRINLLHLLRQQLIKITPNNFYVTQRRNKQSEMRQNPCNNDYIEMMQVLKYHDSNDDDLCHYNENNYGKSKNVDCNGVNDEYCRFQLTPAVYQDPYCSVTVDRKVHIYGYYTQNDQFINSSYLYNIQSTRTIHANDIVVVFHTDNGEQLKTSICRSWGLSRNFVWWAADPRRCDSRKMYLVVLQLNEHPILIGFTVIKLIPFINALKICGLKDDCKFISSLPTVIEFDASGNKSYEDDSLKETRTSSCIVSLKNNMDEKFK